MESKGIHKDYPALEIIRFSSCRGFVFPAFLHGRRGRGLAVEPGTSNRKSWVAGRARQHAAAADLCAGKLTLYKSSPRAAQRRFFSKNTPKGVSRVQGMRLGTVKAQAGLRHVPPTWRCPRKAVADLDPVIGSKHGQARLTQKRPGLALSLPASSAQLPKASLQQVDQARERRGGPTRPKRSNPSPPCHLPLTKNRKSAKVWTGHGNRNPTLARTCANHKQNLPRKRPLVTGMRHMCVLMRCAQPARCAPRVGTRSDHPRYGGS